MTTKNNAKPEKPMDKTPVKTPIPLKSTVPNFFNPSFIILLILVLAALGIASFAVYSALQLKQLTGAVTQNLTKDIKDQAKRLTDFSNNIEKNVTDLSRKQEKLETTLHSLNENLRSTLQQRLYQSQDWMLLKARHYLQLAQINAHWSDNLQATAALLQQADELLSTVHDQRLFEVRQAIAKEVAALNAIPQIDAAGLLSQLDAVQKALLNLPLDKPSLSAKEKNTVESSEKTPSEWRERLKNSINLLERLVVIRRHEENVQPILSKAQETMLRQSIDFYLQKAQWAVLHANNQIYQTALNQAAASIEQAFSKNATGTQSALNQLQKLKEINLKQSKPSIEQSLNLLNQVIDQKDSQTNATENRGEHAS